MKALKKNECKPETLVKLAEASAGLLADWIKALSEVFLREEPEGFDPEGAVAQAKNVAFFHLLTTIQAMGGQNVKVLEIPVPSGKPCDDPNCECHKAEKPSGLLN